MKILVVVLFGTLCLFVGTHSQGFVQPLDPAQQNPYRRQLTTQQQSHILSDIQQHQHRFNLHPSQQQSQSPFLIQQQPSVEIPLNPTQQTILNQRPPPLQQQQPNQVRFPQNNNNFRSNFQSTNNNNNQQIVQHHTQTNFIPNYVQQGQSSQQSFQHQRSLQNQLQIPQQPFQPPSQQKQYNIDQDFHAQNFLTLRNHYVQNPQQQGQLSSGPLQAQPTNQFNQQQQFQQNQPILGLPNFHQAPQFQSSPTFQSVPQIQTKQQFNSNPQFPTVAPKFPPIPNFPIVPQFQQNQNFQPSPQFQSTPQFSTIPNFGNVGKVDDQQSKQKVIQKHEQFVQKQYEKQQNKVKQLHDEFLQKQQSIKLSDKPGDQFDGSTSSRSRGILPAEVPLFDHAVKKYHDENPSVSTTSTTTPGKSKNAEIDDQFERLLQAQRKDIYSQLKLESETPKSNKASKSKSKTSKPVGRDDLLKQLKIALADQPQPSLGNKTFDMMDLVLPNGQRVQVIRTTDPNLISGSNPLPDNIASALSSSSSSSSSPSSLSSRIQLNTGTDNEMKTKTGKDAQEVPKQLQHVAPIRSGGLTLPNGQKVEIVRAPDPSSLGGLSDLSGDISSLYAQSLANEARVTSEDGPPSIEELARKGLIPEGYEIVQQPAPGSAAAAAAAAEPPPPPPKKKPTFVYLEEQADGSFKVQGVKPHGEKEAKTSGAEVDSILDRIKNGDIKLPPSVKKVQLSADDETPSSSSPRTTTQTRAPPTTSIVTQSVTQSPSTVTTRRVTTSAPRVTFPSSTVSPYSTLSPPTSSPSTVRFTAQSSTYQQESSTPIASSSYVSPIISSTYAPVTERLIATTPNQSKNNPDFSQILKSNGLFAMAKYLKQSGLDSILNETGPYTVFVPTDKAFKNLLIQLGGPERAEEKFKTNPRLLSGLLLHHVIPGAFEISALQDEMTGVSLAGTQLRVNQYTMHDQEWNDVMITTINGAMIVTDKQDIKIPQGIAHGVDRVMFPLPVGDLLQTLQSDRERRFTTFLKVLYTSGMSELLQNKGTKTYTVFAPTDKGFENLDSDDLQSLTTDKDAAQAFAMRHIMPGTLFSAGMRFYQIKDSLLPGKTITLQKTSAGKIKVNESQMVTSNIPATNGVIHALDGLL